MLLTKDQAKAVHDAMCALNNVNGNIEVHFESFTVWESGGGYIYIYMNSDEDEDLDEVYASQAKFAEAYQLN